MASSHLPKFSSCLFWSLLVPLWSSPNNTPRPLPPVYLSFEKSQLLFIYFFVLWHGPGSPLLRECSQSSLSFAGPWVNTGRDSSLGVHIMFLQHYQERCVNGRGTGRVSARGGFIRFKSHVTLTRAFCFRWQAGPGGGLGGVPASWLSRAQEGLKGKNHSDLEKVLCSQRAFVSEHFVTRQV